MRDVTSRRARFVQINRRFTAAAAFALLGVTVGVATANFGADDVGRESDAPGAAAQPGNTAAKDLVSQLDDVRRTIGIRADQEEAWRRYTDVAFSLDRERQDFDRRGASGEARNDGAEYWRHQLILGAAISDLKSNLSPSQIARARPLTESLAASLICNGLARN